MHDDYKTPGQLIEALIADRGWTQRVLASVLNIREPALNKLISGKQVLSAEMAIAMEEVFSVDARTFLTLQQDFDLAQARLAAKPNSDRTTRARLFGGLPVSEMIKRGWLDGADVRDMPSVERALTKFFGVVEIDEIEVLPHAAKKTVVGEATTPQQLAWLYRAKQIASEMIVVPFTQFGVRRAVGLLKELTLSAESARKVPRILADCGIRFIIVESLSGSKIDGACFWLNDGASPVIAITMRHDRIDNFWFVLRHEIEHVIQGHGKDKIIIDAELEGENTGSGPEIVENERIANLAAAEFCVPKKTLDAFIARKAPFFVERDILGVAATLRVHPGLVAGQLQRHTGRYDRFRTHLVKMRSIVAPGAIVDGWGDVVPVGI